MNATLLMLTSAWIAGADTAPAKDVAAPVPAVVSTGSSCGGACGSACGDSCAKCGFWSRFKASFAKKSCCAPACAPAPVCNTCKPACSPAPVVSYSVHATCGGCKSACDSCHQGLWSRLKARFKKHSCCDTCNTCGAAGPVAPEVVPPPGQKKEMPKALPKTSGVTSAPIESSETPIVAPKLETIQVGNPF